MAASLGRFVGKIALVTGSASGIGAATARRLANEGCHVICVDKRLPELGILSSSSFMVDVTDEEAVAACIHDIKQTHGGLDILFNNAGVICKADPPESANLADWQRVISTNVFGAVLCTKHASPLLIASRGCIVNTASIAGIRAGAGGNAYSASKAAIINFTQTLACDFGKHGVRVNAVCPGLIETHMVKELFDYARSTGKEEKLGSRCELRRYGTPEEVASVVAFLASADASYITGQAIAVDGGNSASFNLPGMKF
jgi:meso-butanediol dehydrogenase/(S,S)-butanediol dehydrogenase/diacetyl reductase